MEGGDSSPSEFYTVLNDSFKFPILFVVGDMHFRVSMETITMEMFKDAQVFTFSGNHLCTRKVLLFLFLSVGVRLVGLQ